MILHYIFALKWNTYCKDAGRNYPFEALANIQILILGQQIVLLIICM